MLRSRFLILVLALLPGCGSSDESSEDQTCAACDAGAGSETTDAATADSAADSEPSAPDSTAPDVLLDTSGDDSKSDADASLPDASQQDSSPPDAPQDQVAEADATAEEASTPEASTPEASTPEASTPEASTPEASTPEASTPEASTPEASTGIISGGPCLSGAPGQTAYRVKWIGSGNYPQLVYEVNGLPDHNDHTGVYGYSMGFTPQFVDPYLGEGGLLLDSSDFIDIELSTVGVSSIKSITLSIYGRSFNTTSSGSFTWQTFEGTGSSPYGLVSNSAPYEWYSADMTTDITPGNGNVLLRIKSGPPSGSLVVNRVELCMEAN